jgi:16S rRNA (uracil1498-N3)-methyltransferase
MHRFYLPPEQAQHSPLILEDREAHHAVDVLRLREGERVIVLDGAGHERLCHVRKVGRKEVALEIIDARFVSHGHGRITLAQAVPKGKRMEDVIQKATELGVARIVPLLTERVATRLDEEGAADKAAKWRQTAVEAIKQCGQLWLPEIEAPVALDAFVERKEAFDLSLVGSLQGDGRYPRQYFESFAEAHKREPQTICIWIGPEGDFSHAELDRIRRSGALPITLGSLVLRTDTAALCSVAIVNYELQVSRK